MSSIRLVTFPFLVSTLLASCVIDEDVEAGEDGENDSFPSGKADGGIDANSVEAAGVLALVNDQWIDADLLVTDAGLARRAARNIIAHRDGADGTFGTADDNLFDTLAELDAVLYVGPVTLNKLVGYAEGHGYVQRWSNRASMSTERTYFGAVRGADGRIYAVGGTGTVTMEAYAPSTNTWAQLAEMPTPRYGHAVAIGADGKIYAIGGYNTIGDRAYHATVEAYTPSTNTWETLAPMPTARALHSAVTGPDGRIYVIGGYNEQRGTLRTVEVYTPSTNTWATAASMPSARYTLATAVGDDGNIYAFGGTINNESQATVEAYNPTTNTWSTLDKMFTPRTGLAAVTAKDGLIYLIGGDDGRSIFPLTTVLTFKASTKAWSGVQSNLVGRSHLAAAEGADGKLYVLGGYEPINGAMATVEAYTR